MKSITEVINSLGFLNQLKPGQKMVHSELHVSRSGISYHHVYTAKPQTCEWIPIKNLEKVRDALKAEGIKYRTMYKGPRPNRSYNGFCKPATTTKGDAYYFTIISK